ncbi:hypothetical protein C7974DRAFT_306660 [Boeremia exigua]|uniref:uncharacterized protein n=1 Tax=Boeremia exigua TaxID=749465 RepID=UPI001E8E385F|nr:uncharacterized protein C7974DRAFT_306660 [Boeremia exigua]KAH6638028.1 hypothetical protein C7974DRAFT_306660 [Boeremia exigua]
MKYKTSVPKHLSQRAWNILWKSRYADFLDVSRRETHLAKLNRDFLKAPTSPVAGQVAYSIEQKFMAGMQEQALDMWAGSRHDFATAPEYLDVGTRLYALAGHADQSRDIMDHLLQLDPNWDPTIIMAVFRAYTSSGLDQHIDKAREMYRAIKERMGTESVLEAYDSCMVGFLETRSLPDAKRVFQDMIRAGCLETTGSESHVQGVIRRLNLLYALGTNITSMSGIALDAIDVLPVAYHGHIFTDWMKSALAERSPEAAAHILDSMIRRGYRPVTEDYNLLLRTLFGTKLPDNILRAEDIGWKMIEEARLSSIPTEQHPSGSRVKAIAEKLQNVGMLDGNSAASVPAANATTFALIMRHHASNSQWEHVDYLTRQLRLAEVEINCAIMNVLIDNKCHKGQFREAWQIYTSITDDPDRAGTVYPDGETMRILWKTLRIALSDPANREDPNLPTPRKLLRETIDWWMLVRHRPDAHRFIHGLATDNKGAITRLMLHCFSYAQDLAGALVALHVLRQQFEIYPTRDAARIVIRQQAWQAMHDETESVRRQFGLSKNNARNLQRLQHTYEHMFWLRLQRLDISEDMYWAYSYEEKGDFELNAISEFVRYALHAQWSMESVERLISSAATVAGVQHMSTGDRTVFDIFNTSQV